MFLITSQTQNEFVLLIPRAQSVLQTVVFHLISPRSILIKFSFESKIISFLSQSLLSNVSFVKLEFIYTLTEFQLPVKQLKL